MRDPLLLVEPDPLLGGRESSTVTTQSPHAQARAPTPVAVDQHGSPPSSAGAVPTMPFGR